ALGQAALRFTGRFKRIRAAELKLFLAAALEDAQNVARLAQRKARQRIEERQDALLPRHFRRQRNRAFQTQRYAVQSVSLAETIILMRVTAVVVKRRAPEHRAVAHHAVADVAHDFTMTETACLVGDAQIAGVHELNELSRF